MTKFRWLVGLPFVMGTTVGALGSPTHAESDWVLNNCDDTPSFNTDWRRSDARAYASSANGDGYDWGGGCWNGDGQDNTPNQDGYHNSDGEGPDCSGFVHKAWALANNGTNNRRYWPPLNNVYPDAHGPYTAASLKAGVDAADQLPNTNYGTTLVMDAFASSSHVGMIYSEGSGGDDTIVEAKDQQIKTGIFPHRHYRFDPDYSGVKRAVWDQ